MQILNAFQETRNDAITPRITDKVGLLLQEIGEGSSFWSGEEDRMDRVINADCIRKKNVVMLQFTRRYCVSK